MYGCHKLLNIMSLPHSNCYLSLIIIIYQLDNNIILICCNTGEYIL